jgi:hypothetical protein
MMKKIILPAAAALAVALAGCGGSGSSQPPRSGTVTAPATSVPAPQAAGGTMPVSPSAAVLAGRLKAAGLPVTGLITYTESTDPNHLMGRQGGYSSKVAWQDPRAEAAGAGQPSGPDETGSVAYGGGVEAFPDVASAYARYQELKGFTAPLGDGYDDIEGTAVLRLSQYLTPAQAHAYQAVFRKAIAQG